MMLLIKKYFILLLLANPAFYSAKNKTDDFIDWRAGRKLEWNDYKSKPDPTSDAAASTTTYLGIEYHFSNNQFTYSITCRFSKNRSWGLYQTDYILSHEQGHFDITEIFARTLNKMMTEYKFNTNTYQDDLRKIYDDIQDEKEKIQNQYDDETDYSRKKEKQAEWLKQIEEMLTSLNHFSDYH